MKTLSEIPHILVIDDDEFLLYAIKKKLELAGYKITICNNVQDAYFKTSMMRPDLILLDVILPEMNGIELMSMINTQYLPDKVPVILMSFLPKDELYAMGYNLNNVHYLNKPLELSQLPRNLKHFVRTF